MPCIMIKGSIQQEAITLVNICGPNIGASNTCGANTKKPKWRYWLQYNTRGLL